MNAEATHSEQRKAAPSSDLWRPEETFWQRYSPHHEFPLATVGAITICGVVIAFLFLVAFLSLFGLNNEVDAPVGVDVASTEPAGGGGGFDGLGTGTSPLGTKMTEMGADDIKRTSTPMRPLDPTPPLVNPDIKPGKLDVPPDVKDPSPDAKVFEGMQKEANQIEREQGIEKEREKNRKAVQKAMANGTGGPPGGRNSPGSGGGQGGGWGTGVGTGVGPGGGGGPFGNRQATPQEIHAYRWRIYLSDDIEQHRRTLIAMRVTYVFEDQAGRQYKVLDLRRTPVETVAIPRINPREVVAWEQRDIRLLRALAQKLQLKFWPSKGIITLPADVEERLAAVEREAAERQGRAPETIRVTHFDVKIGSGGAYEPFVSRFE